MDPATVENEQSKKPAHVRVTVTFPLANKPPFHKDDPPDTTVAAVLAGAMAHFEVTDDETTTYYLTHDHEKADPTKTVGELAGDKHEVKFTLAKEITQG